jgi:hypothetical protein
VKELLLDRTSKKASGVENTVLVENQALETVEKSR